MNNIRKYTHKCVCGWVGYEKGSGHAKELINGIPLEVDKLSDEDLTYLRSYVYKIAYLLKSKARLFNFMEWVADGSNVCPKCHGRFVLDLRKYGDDVLKNKTLKCIKNTFKFNSPVVVTIANNAKR